MKIFLAPFTNKRIDGKPHAKEYPFWEELLNLITIQDEVYQYVMPGDKELVKSVIPHVPFKDFFNIVKEMDTFLCVDSYLPHFMNCHFPDKRGFVLFGPSDPTIWGYQQNFNLTNGRSFWRPNQFETWNQWEANPESHVNPLDVYSAITKYKRSLVENK